MRIANRSLNLDSLQAIFLFAVIFFSLAFCDNASAKRLNLENSPTHKQLPKSSKSPESKKSAPQYPADSASFDLPMSGTNRPDMANFDKTLCAFMKYWQIPGASVAIAHKGKLVYAKGYGYADFAEKKPVETSSLFRIASISKIITAVAVLKLVEEGKLSLSSNPFKILNIPPDPNPARRPDERVFKITVKQLLESTAGWDRKGAGDPMFIPLVHEAAFEYSNSLRPSPQAIIRYNYTKPLDFNPGTKFAYSNFGYCVLGELISKVSGQPYAQYVKEKILAPMGITDMIPGKTRELAFDEVSYYAYPNENYGQSVFPNVQGNLPLEYGGDFYLEAMNADCGWLGTPIDIARFISCFFGECGEKLQPLSRKMTELMISRPNMPDWEGQNSYFAMGWEVESVNEGKEVVVKKEGSLPGLSAVAVHSELGDTFVVAFNSRPALADLFQEETLNFIVKTLGAHKKW